MALAGALVTFAALLLRRAPLRSRFIGLLSAGLLVGFIGACFRLAGTSDLASQYSAAAPSMQPAIVHSYDDLLRLINMLFSASELIAGLGLGLVVSAIRSMSEFKRWPTVLIGIAAFLYLATGLLELMTGADLGPLALLASLLLIISFVAIARRFWRSSTHFDV